MSLLTTLTYRNDGPITLAVSRQTGEMLGEAQAGQDRCLLMLFISCVNSNVLPLPNEDRTENYCVVFKM